MTLKWLLQHRYAKPIVFVICLIPLAVLFGRAVNDGLGANPVEAITHETGQWALRLLLVTLALSPICKWTQQPKLLRFRRMFGLYAFFYAGCHFLIWLVADHALVIADMFEDIVERPYITFGFSALLLMMPLVATSNQSMIKRLGRRWNSLHKLTYLVAILAILHYLWLVKTDYTEAGIYAAIGGFLLLQRVKIRQLVS